jgi:hypothetical protein
MAARAHTIKANPEPAKGRRPPRLARLGLAGSQQHERGPLTMVSANNGTCVVQVFTETLRSILIEIV